MIQYVYVGIFTLIILIIPYLYMQKMSVILFMKSVYITYNEFFVKTI